MSAQTDMLTSRLPPELALEIFQWFCQPEKRLKWTEYSPPTTKSTPLFLGRVCYFWRHLVWMAPNLWSSLCLTLDRGHYVTQVSLLKEWLERSGNRPLDIIIRGPGSDEEEAWEVNPPHEIMHQLAVVSDRWCAVDMFIPYPCYAGLSTIENRLPLLESLVIRPPDGVDAEFDYRLDFFRNAPRLQELTMSGIYYSDATELPWPQFCHLSGQDFCIDDCYTMMQRSPQLVTCQFDAMHQSSDFAYPCGHVIRMPQLKTFEATSIGSMLSSVLLDSLELPLLTDITLSLGFSFDDWESFSTSALVSLITRSGCSRSLQCLTIINIRLVEEELIECLRAATALVELHLHVEYPKSSPGMFISDDLIAALSPPSLHAHERQTSSNSVCSAPPVLVPNLEVLDYSGPVHISGRALQIMLEYRWRARYLPSEKQHPARRLRDVTVESASSVDLSPEVKSALRDLTKEGMRLVLTNGYTSWIHDNWLPLHTVVNNTTCGEWVPNRYQLSGIYHYSFLPSQLESKPRSDY